MYLKTGDGIDEVKLIAGFFQRDWFRHLGFDKEAAAACALPFRLQRPMMLRV